MGINISVYRILGVKTETDEYPHREYKYFETERHPSWDYLRYSGDRDFWMSQDFDWEDRYEGEIESDHSFQETYHRPKDLDKAIDWVKQNIVEGNQKRLIDILEEMKTDKDLYFTCSY